MRWEYFDKIYCISLDERSDRRKEANAQFDAVGLLENVEFVIVKKHPIDCEQGIFESHLLCMQKGIFAGADNIVIFEDDVCFDRFSPQALKSSIDFLSVEPNWKILFLGCMVRGSRKTENKSVLNIDFRSLCHAYVIKSGFAQQLVTDSWQKTPFDDMLRDLRDHHFYAVYPSFAFQGNSRSDNHRYLALDRFRRLCGGLRRLQKMNEFFHLNKRAIVMSHVLLAMALVVILTG
ncbi:MAG: glycosyltransferase [Deltaproteobacteria bacterium]|nr:glycosyltransferase [Deltaproteobacteria bacterium]